LGWCAFLAHHTDAAIEELQRALAINPNFAAALGHIGQVFAFDGQVEKAMSYSEQALRLDPHNPQNFLFITALAVAHYCASRYSEAISFARKAIQQRPEFTGSYRIYIASLAQAGQLDEARTALDELRKLQPEFSVDWVSKNTPYTQTTMPIVIEGLRRAGL